MTKDSLGDRMKDYYEGRNKHFLTRRVPVMLRLDGKAFHTFTRGSEKPFDQRIINAMECTAKHLVENIQGAKVAYVQSDEISILLTDYDRLETDAWYDYNQSKMESVSASMAGVYFTVVYNHSVKRLNFDDIKLAYFDCRAFNIPREEVTNCFRWRYQDWIRNSIQMLAQSLYSHEELHGKKTPDLHELCFQKGHNWNDLSPQLKNGTLIVRGEEGAVSVYDFNLNSNEQVEQIFGQFL